MFASILLASDKVVGGLPNEEGAVKTKTQSRARII